MHVLVYYAMRARTNSFARVRANVKIVKTRSTSELFRVRNGGAMEELTVTVKQGKLRGKTGTDFSGRTFYSFQGIPYAKPPLGNLRFKNPQPPESWEGIRDATSEGSVCYQRNMRKGVIEGSEDCLFLNVYTPQINKGKDATLRPVMFYIHGGLFTSSSGNTEKFGPEYLVANDVVLVTTNYRLGLLGFLTLEAPTLEIYGNAGLKDITLALQWVQSNIQNFLGDPKNVTIFGESAGSAAVQYLLLSPVTNGLFHKAIMQSGSAFNGWARGYKHCERFSQALDLETSNETKIVEALQQLSLEQLHLTQEKLVKKTPANKRPYGPTVEKPSINAFLTEEPKTILQSGGYNKVPLLIGYNDAEGILGIILANAVGGKPVHNDFESFVPLAFGLEKGSEKSKQVAQKIKEYYYGDQQPSVETLEAFVKLESDAHFVHGIQKTTENAAKSSHKPVFLYRFTFDGQIYYIPRIIAIPFKGANHADELTYLFKNQFSPEVKSGSLVEVTIKRMTRLWTNFAKYGNPNSKDKDDILDIQWKPAIKGEYNYLNIDEELSTGVNPDAERIEFWDKLYEEFPHAKYW